MAIVPCSMHTMSSIACGLASNLITRAADVALKEKRRLVLVVRETPLHLGHLRNMVSLAEMGAVIAPPMPAFYMLPRTIDDIVDQHVVRLLDLLGVVDTEANRWSGI
jgi:4-hydroxy-3-polyprenylbenzoate decarboxylase